MARPVALRAERRDPLGGAHTAYVRRVNGRLLVSVYRATGVCIGLLGIVNPKATRADAMVEARSYLVELGARA